MGGAPALGGAGAGAAEVEALLREFPALGRTEDGRVKCSLTGHVMHAKPEVVRPYVRGKRFTQASAKARAMDALKQFEPHIVRSAFLPDKLFCRITGRYLAANERAVAQHSAGRRFERGVEALSRLKTETGAKNVLLTERDVDPSRCAECLGPRELLMYLFGLNTFRVKLKTKEEFDALPPKVNVLVGKANMSYAPHLMPDYESAFAYKGDEILSRRASADLDAGAGVCEPAGGGNGGGGAGGGAGPRASRVSFAGRAAAAGAGAAA